MDILGHFRLCGRLSREKKKNLLPIFCSLPNVKEKRNARNGANTSMKIVLTTIHTFTPSLEGGGL